MSIRILQGHVLDKLAELPEASVHMCVTSPPYYGVRAYGTQPQVWGGDPDHAHEWGPEIPGDPRGGSGPNAKEAYAGDGKTTYARGTPKGAFCPCGAWRGELGSEPTPKLFVEHIVEVFRAVRRVLRPDGTLWLNLGDVYAANRPYQAIDNKHRDGGNNGGMRVPPGLKPKDLCMIPARVALALQADGWWLRSTIIWSKPNPMPESVGDRPTTSHEYVYLLSLSATYYYDSTAVAEPARDTDAVRDIQWQHERQDLFNLPHGSTADRVLSEEERAESRSTVQAVRECPRHGVAAPVVGQGIGTQEQREVQPKRARQGEAFGVQPNGEASGNGAGIRSFSEGQGGSREVSTVGEAERGASAVLRERQGANSHRAVPADGERAGVVVEGRPQTAGVDREYQQFDSRRVDGDQDDLPECLCVLRSDGSAVDQGSHSPSLQGWPSHERQRDPRVPSVQQPQRGATRNLRTVWTISTQPTPEAHFATFPEKLVEPCILAGSSEKGVCPACGAPWARQTEPSEELKARLGASWHDHQDDDLRGQRNAPPPLTEPARVTVGWQPSCQCAAGEPAPATVLDCFGGSGTTARVAERLGRHSLLVELNPDYITIAQRRAAQRSLLSWAGEESAS